MIRTKAKPSWCFVTRTKYFAPAAEKRSSQSSGFHVDAVQLAIKLSYTVSAPYVRR